jgi:hypothetical protein
MGPSQHDVAVMTPSSNRNLEPALTTIAITREGSEDGVVSETEVREPLEAGWAPS